MVYGPVIPFYDMKNEEEFNPGRPPVNPHEEVAGLQEAIEATKRIIAEYEAKKRDISGLKTHLKSLEQRLEAARLKTAKKK